MKTSYKFRLYPNKEQEEKLMWTLEKCRQTYNFFLDELNKQEIIDKSLIQGLLPDMKICEPELNDIYSKVLQYECYRLFSNLRTLSRLKKNGRKVGKLRFKGKNWFKTFTYNQSGFDLIQTGKRNHGLRLSKIGEIPIRVHRKVEGKIKQITIKKYSSGKWFAIFSVEKKTRTVQKVIEKVVGIDVGITHFTADSDGNYVDHPHYLDKSLKKLKRECRQPSRKKKKSNNRKKQKLRRAIVYEKVTNQRSDFLHKISRVYVNTYDCIVVENLNIRGLIDITYNSRNLIDSSWDKLIHMMSYKAETAGKTLIKVEPRGTSQRCSSCGEIVKKEIYVRTHECPYCGTELERDFNASLNILKLGLETIGQGLSEFTPVEIKPLPARASSVAEAGSSFI